MYLTGLFLDGYNNQIQNIHSSINKYLIKYFIYTVEPV